MNILPCSRDITCPRCKNGLFSHELSLNLAKVATEDTTGMNNSKSLLKFVHVIQPMSLLFEKKKRKQKWEREEKAYYPRNGTFLSTHACVCIPIL
jgi:hypothetical protein